MTGGRRRRSFPYAILAWLVAVTACLPAAPAATPAPTAEPVWPRGGAAPQASAVSAPGAAADPSLASPSPAASPVARAAASPAPANGSAELVVAVPTDPDALDPILVASTPSSLVSRLIFDPLVDTNAWTGETEPRLAESWTLVEPLVWEFRLRPGARFQNGDPVTSADVAASYTRAIADPRSRLATSKAIIREADAVDDRTVRVVTRVPYPTFLDQLGRMGITPRRALDEQGAEAFNRRPVGAGPFRLAEWASDDHVTLTRFDDYWRRPASLARITLRVIPTASGRLAELETGRAALAVQIAPEEGARLRGAGFAVQSAPTRRTMLLGFNVGTGTAGEIAEEPLRDLRVRQAIGYAIDIEGIARDILAGAATPVGGTLTPQNFGYDADLAPWPHDPERARQLLVDAGYPDGVTLDFDVPSGRYLRDREVGEAIAGQLAAVGVKTRLSVQEWGAYSARYTGQKFRGLWLLGIGKEFQADAHLFTYYSSRGRGWYFADAEVDRLVDDISTGFDPTARAAGYAALERRLREIVPAVFLYQQVETYASSPRLRWTATPDDYLWLYEAAFN